MLECGSGGITPSASAVPGVTLAGLGPLSE